MTNNNEIILIDSDKAAKFVTDISGWVNSKGHFYGNNEHAARYDGCTHTYCKECGAICQKYYTLCENCRSVKQDDKYSSMQQKHDPDCEYYYSYVTDEYYTYEDLIYLYQNAELDHPSKLQLILTTPEFGYNYTLTDEYFSDITCDDSVYIPADIQDAMDEFNRILMRNKTPFSYSPSKYRVPDGYFDHIVKEDE